MYYFLLFPVRGVGVHSLYSTFFHFVLCLKTKFHICFIVHTNDAFATETKETTNIKAYLDISLIQVAEKFLVKLSAFTIALACDIQRRYRLA